MRLFFSSYVGEALTDVNVHLRADAEIGKVNARLDGEACAGNDAPGVVRLQIIHIGPCAVYLYADTMARAMEEIWSEAVLFNVATSHVVYLVSGYSLAGTQLFDYKL